MPVKKQSFWSRCCCRRAPQKRLTQAEQQEENKKLTEDVGKNFDMAASYDLLSDGIILVEIDKKGDKHKIRFINTAASTLTGYSKTEVLGKKPNLFMPDDIAHVHDGYIAQWKMSKKDKNEDSKDSHSGSASGDDEDPHPTIVSLESIDMTKGQIRAVPLKTKTNDELQVHIRLNMFVKGNRVFALAIVRQQALVSFVNWEDTIFHIIDRDTHLDEKGLTIPHSSNMDSSRSLSSLSGSDREEGEDQPASSEVLNVYINPPSNSSLFGDIKLWSFQPDGLSTAQKNKYIRIITDKITKAKAEVSRGECLITAFVKPPGIPLSSESTETLKQKIVGKFNNMPGGHKDPVCKCMVSLSSKKHTRVLPVYGSQ